MWTPSRFSGLSTAPQDRGRRWDFCIWWIGPNICRKSRVGLGCLKNHKNHRVVWVGRAQPWAGTACAGPGCSGALSNCHTHPWTQAKVPESSELSLRGVAGLGRDIQAVGVQEPFQMLQEFCFVSHTTSQQK